MALFDNIRNVMTYVFPSAIEATAELKVSIKRIQVRYRPIYAITITNVAYTNN